jgi:hypothetical protein
MNYPQSFAEAPFRQAPSTRFYLCPGCSTPQSGPQQGGTASCPTCHAPCALRSRSPATDARTLPMPDNSPERLQMLRMQDASARGLPATLAAVLGGAGLQVGREQEALAIWQSLRSRAAQGDVAASEDLTMLTLMLSQHPPVERVPNLVAALNESACDVAVLPRHRAMQLGLLAREAARAGDLESARRYLSSMAPNAPELEADSQLRITAAVVATVGGDPRGVLAALGVSKAAVPLAEIFAAMATVLRANALEQVGDLAAAQQLLTGEMASPHVLDAVRRNFPAQKLCERSGASYTVVATTASATSARWRASLIGLIFGVPLTIAGIVELTSSLSSDAMAFSSVFAIFPLMGAGLTVAGVVTVVRALLAGQRAASLSLNGLSLEARVLDATPTMATVNHVPEYRLTLEVAGPQGPYRATQKKVLRDHQLTALIGHTVLVRANPNKLDDLIFEA